MQTCLIILNKLKEKICESKIIFYGYVYMVNLIYFFYFSFVI